MNTFAHLLDLLRIIPDPRRAQRRMYILAHLLLLAILAVVAGAYILRLNWAENIWDARYQLAFGGGDPLLKCRVM